MSIRMFNSLCGFVLCFPAPVLKVLQEIYWHSFSFFSGSCSLAVRRSRDSFVVLCLGDRQEVHPSRPHIYHLLSAWCTSRGLASSFSRETSNINGDLRKIHPMFCIKRELPSRLCSPLWGKHFNINRSAGEQAEPFTDSPSPPTKRGDAASSWWV